jgi:hypothetical protein
VPVKQINHLVRYQAILTPARHVITAKTELPATPKLFRTCHPVQDIPFEKDREGTRVPHGIKKWSPSIDCQDDPTSSLGTIYSWDLPPCCPPGSPCNWFIAQLGTKPSIDWITLVHSCSEAGPGTTTWRGRFTGWDWSSPFARRRITLQQLEQVGSAIVFDGVGTFHVAGGGIFSLSYVAPATANTVEAYLEASLSSGFATRLLQQEVDTFTTPAPPTQGSVLPPSIIAPSAYFVEIASYSGHGPDAITFGGQITASWSPV